MPASTAKKVVIDPAKKLGQAIRLVEQHNRWLRGLSKKMPVPPDELGKAIELVVWLAKSGLRAAQRMPRV